jgi:hypothetical protein
MRSLFRRFKNDAKQRGYTWNLTDEAVQTLMQQHCFYCDAPPSQIAKHVAGNGHYVYNGLDRKDNTRGYEPDNVVACCKFCNYAKGDRTVEAFLAWIGAIYRHAVHPE